jgi:hypothetical protein
MKAELHARDLLRVGCGAENLALALFGLWGAMEQLSEDSDICSIAPQYL